MRETQATGADPLLELTSVPISAGAILSELVPPRHFDHAEFSNYIPEPGYPSQSHALRQVRKFIEGICTPSSNNFFKRFWGKEPDQAKGIYLDGGFGVGKTHLLASAFHAFDGPKAYLSFQELMFLVGLQSLKGVVASFKDFKLLVIDEFELDDPANTRISTNLLGRLFASGVSILTSSNTPPGALGDGKFSIEDFKRELGSLTEQFTTLKIDGEDYRIVHHLDDGAGSSWASSETELELLLKSENVLVGKLFDSSFDEFLVTLSKVHPMRIRRAIGKFDTVILRDVKQIAHPYEALRFVYFVDKAYDNDLLLFVHSSVAIDDIFHRSYFTGGDTKKYMRTMSRLMEMTRITNNALKPEEIS
ncbi:MAG: cell division protein ZapE [Candidatus Kapaibacterium sp.]